MKFLKDNWKLLALLSSAALIYFYPALMVPVASSTAAVILTSYLSSVLSFFKSKKSAPSQEVVSEEKIEKANDEVVECSSPNKITSALSDEAVQVEKLDVVNDAANDAANDEASADLIAPENRVVAIERPESPEASSDEEEVEVLDASAVAARR